MEDGRIGSFEESLWTGDEAHYRALIDEACLMVLPRPPFLFHGAAAATAVSETPRWSSVRFAEQQVARPQEGLIVIAYAVHAEREGVDPYQAHCTTTLRRLSHEEWRVVQHQQTPPLTVEG